MSVALVVIAKAPHAGRVDRRLCPPCSFEEAATLGVAALADTVEAVDATPVRGPRVLVLDGEPGYWVPAGWYVIERRGRDPAEHLANAFDDVGGPALVVGSETPQVTPALLAACVEALRTPRIDAVLGPARGGGCWAFGLREPEPAVFLGVSESGREVLEARRQRLRALGIPFAELPTLREVETMADAWAVASEARATRFAGTLASMLEPTQAVATLA